MIIHKRLIMKQTDAKWLCEDGRNEDDANYMCPWKTGITIDQRDNSVCVRGYRTARYM